MKNIIGLVGNNADQSTNRQLLEYMQCQFKELANIELMEVKGLPLFDKPKAHALPQQVMEMAQKIEAADGLVIATPEYDHSIPAALSNALSWLSYGIFPLVDKPVMVIGASYGLLGSSRAQTHLRSILNAPVIKAIVMPGNEFLLSHSLQAFDSQGQMVDQDQASLLEACFMNFLNFIQVSEVLTLNHEANVKLASDYFHHQGAKREEI